MNIQTTVTLNLNEEALSAVDRLSEALDRLNAAGSHYDSQAHGAYGQVYLALRRTLEDVLTDYEQLTAREIYNAMAESGLSVRVAIEKVVQEVMTAAVR